VITIKRKKSKASRIFVAFFATIIFAVAFATVALGFFVADSDMIFPNVSAEGINLAGMTLDEANHRLVSMGFEDNAAPVAVTVYFPDGSSFFISGADAGFSQNAEEAALAAFQHGRSDSFFANTLTYIRSLGIRTNLNGTPALDEDFVRGEVAVHTRRFNESLIQNLSHDIDEYSITIIPGSCFAPASEDSVFALVAATLYAALETNTHLTVDYTPAQADAEDFDFYALYNSIHTEPVSAAFAPGTFDVIESSDGVSFDIDAAKYQFANANAGEAIVIPLIFTEPEITTEYLQGRLFRDELAVRTTTVGGNANRFNNVSLAADAIHGLVLNPGDEFSFNEVVGQRTSARGYLPAGGFRDGRLVDMVGGGICQVSSTIYDNVLHARLQVTARRAHTLPIAYLPLGHDAAIYWGQLDLRFINDTDYPIRIEFEFDEREMTSRLIGTRTDYYVVRIESRSSATPFTTDYTVNPNLSYGQTIVDFRGANGAVAYTYRIIYDAEGNQVSRTRIARDVYRAQNRRVYVAPPDARPPASAYEPGPSYPPAY